MVIPQEGLPLQVSDGLPGCTSCSHPLPFLPSKANQVCGVGHFLLASTSHQLRVLRGCVTLQEKTMGFAREIEAAFCAFPGPTFHVLGNHDVDVLSQRQFLSCINNGNIGEPAVGAYSTAHSS